MMGYKMTKHVIIGIFFLLLLAFGSFVLFHGTKTAEVYVTIYYLGELTIKGYHIEGDYIVLKFQTAENSEDIKKNFKKFKIRCFFCNLELENTTILVDGISLNPTCRNYIMSFDNGKDSVGMHYIVSPYNLSEIAEIRIPRGYKFKGLKFENSTLTILLTSGGSEEVRIIRSEVIAKHKEGLKSGWVRVIYTDGSRNWGGRVYSVGEGECPILIEM